MLILARKLDESIVIGNDITIKVIKIGDNKARLLIKAPREISVRLAEKPAKNELAASFNVESYVSQPNAQIGEIAYFREQGDAVCIGGDVMVKIVKISADKVRLGITAPEAVSAHRQEVYDAIQQEKMRNSVATDSQPAAGPSQDEPPQAFNAPSIG